MTVFSKAIKETFIQACLIIYLKIHSFLHEIKFIKSILW